MQAKRTRRILTRTLLVLGISIGIFVFVFERRITSVYDNTIQPTAFEDVIFEKDTAKKSIFPVKNLPVTDSSNLNPDGLAFNPKSTNQWFGRDSKTLQGAADAMDTDPSKIKEVRKGKEIKSNDIPLMHTLNSRIRLTTFLSKFKEGDYISGLEFSNLYRRDPSIGKLSKGTICNFIEKNINKLTRSGNSFIIQTTDPNGIHTKLKIPFVEDLRINIDNGSSVVIGDAFTSKAPAFSKSILLPIKLQNIDILHNGEQFPTSGYVSGDYYFIDYSKTKMAYKLR